LQECGFTKDLISPKLQDSVRGNGMMFDESLIRILACPVCKGGLNINREKTQLHCRECDVKYPIKDGIPMMMPPEMQE
jgi:uncharacterized protein YbaR (Trm112 family)